MAATALPLLHSSWFVNASSLPAFDESEANTMTRFFRLPLALALLLVIASLVYAQANNPDAQLNGSNVAVSSGRSALVPATNRPANSDNGNASANDPNATIADPLVRMLIAKGILTAEEGRSISATGNAAEQRDRLAALLLAKG